MKCHWFLSLVLAAAANAYAEESPREIVTHLRNAYAALRSYSDTGVVLIHLHDGERPNETAFRSAFVRPQRFRFEWVTHHPYPPLRHLTHNSVIWSNAGGVYSWTDMAGKDAVPKKQPSFALAVAGATGVSSGAAYTIASLMARDAELGEPMIERITSLELAGIEPFEGITCYRLAGQHADFGTYEFWIGKEDYLLRKITHRIKGVLHEEIRRDIQTDVALDEQLFASEK